MKKIIVVILLLFASLSSEAQKFLRYQMNNNTYNGFYTRGVESILHDFKNGIATTFVNASGKVYEIPVEDINCISVEDANISNDNIGQYRIYEFNYEDGDIKKLFADNRASLFASHNGDFGANDTILFSSAYNDVAWIFYTDDQGRIKKFFDGNSLMFIDYDSDDEFTVLDLSTNTSSHYNLTSSYVHRSYRAPSLSGIIRFVRSLIQQIGTLEGQQAVQSAQSAIEFAKNLEVVQNNPELHNQVLFSDWSSVGLDVLSIGASIVGGIPTGGATLAGLGLSVGSLLNDIVGLINDTWPDSEQMDRYKEYYRNKYYISVASIEPENVSYTSAILRGRATSTDGFIGYYTFKLYGENDIEISGAKDIVNDGNCIISANAENLKPGSSYFYSLSYTCKIDGLQLVFYADNIAEFMTLSPTAYTGEVQSKSSDRAEVTCQFYNFPEGAICGVEYSCNDGKAEERANATHEGEYYFTLAPLKPNTTYTYQAFVVIDGVYVYADETKQFTTDKGGLCPDNNHPHMIDLGLPSGTKWACCNVGASKPEEAGALYAWGETSTKSEFRQDNYEFCPFPNMTYQEIGDDISGTNYDTAKVNWGDKWQTANLEDTEELIYNCSVSITEYNGIKGALLKGKNGSKIFLPCNLMSIAVKPKPFLMYWTSTYKEKPNSYNQSAYQLVWSNYLPFGIMSNGQRCDGKGVRPIQK